MIRGEIYLAPFAYSDLEHEKRRPVCVVSSEGFHDGPDAIVAMVTSRHARLQRPGVGDIIVSDWKTAGLLSASVIRTGKMQTLEKTLLDGPRGCLTAQDLEAIDQALRSVLGLA